MSQRDLATVRRLARRRREVEAAFRQAIVVARASGETLRAIAAEAGLTEERVRQILREEEGRESD